MRQVGAKQGKSCSASRAGGVEGGLARWMMPHSLRLRSFVLQAIVLGYSLTAGAFHANPPSFLNEPTGLIRLGIAVAVGMLGAVARDYYSPARPRSPNSLVLDMTIIYGL